jgi:hypothetical protein
MLHDTCVHHADAAFTADTAFRVAPDLAAGAISEALELLCAPGAETFKPALAELRGNGETLRLSPTERSESGWLITRTPLGARWERGTAAAADVVATGAVRDLLLLFTRRLTADDPAVVITGDDALMKHWLAHTAL